MYHSAVLFNYSETLKVLLQENKFLSRMIEHYLSKELSGKKKKNKKKKFGAFFFFRVPRIFINDAQFASIFRASRPFAARQ